MKKHNSEFKSTIVELDKTGRKVLELSREYGVSEVTIYNGSNRFLQLLQLMIRKLH